MAEVPFRPAHQLSEYKGKGASASREKIMIQSNGRRPTPWDMYKDSSLEINFLGLLI